MAAVRVCGTSIQNQTNELNSSLQHFHKLKVKRNLDMEEKSQVARLTTTLSQAVCILFASFLVKRDSDVF